MVRQRVFIQLLTPRWNPIFDIAIAAVLSDFFLPLQNMAAKGNGKSGIIRNKTGLNDGLFKIAAACPHLSAYRTAFHAFFGHIQGKGLVVPVTYILKIYYVTMGPQAAYGLYVPLGGVDNQMMM